MFEIEQKDQKIIITTKQAKLSFDLEMGQIEAGLPFGAIAGPGEFEIGEAMVRGVALPSGQTIYDVEIGGIKIGILDGIEEGLDEIVADILCTTSVRAVREIAPKVVVAMGNIDGMVTELKVAVTAEKKLKVKNRESLPTTLEVVGLQ